MHGSRYRKKHSIAQPFSPDGCDTSTWKAVSEIVAKCDEAAEVALHEADCGTASREAALLFASAWASHGLQQLQNSGEVEGEEDVIEIDGDDPLRAVEAIVARLCEVVSVADGT